MEFQDAPGRLGATLAVIAVVVAAFAVVAHAQGGRETTVPKPSTLPNRYRLVPDWPTLPATMEGPNGHRWGEVISVHVAANGNICRGIRRRAPDLPCGVSRELSS